MNEIENDSSNPILGSNENWAATLKTRISHSMSRSVPTTVPKYPYKLARLVHHKYNLKKRWYVDYWVWDINKDELTRVRQFDPMNRKKTLNERLEIGGELVSLINNQLMSGRVLGQKKILVDSAHHEIRNLTINKAIEYFINQKRLDKLRENSLSRFETLINLWNYYFEHAGVSPVSMKDLSAEIASEFFAYLQTVRQVSNKTFNNYRGDLITFFNWCAKKARLKNVNPFQNLVTLRVVTRKHASYSGKQIEMIKNKCAELGELELLIYIQFLFYTLIRPTELLQLQVKHIELSDNRIFVPGTISKNRYDEFIPIAEPLRQLIEVEKIHLMPSDYFVIGGPVHKSNKTLWTHHSRILKSLKLNGQNHTVYSYKHSGAISLYKATKDIVLVQRMCRHRSLQETQTYLRDLGLMMDYKTMLNAWNDSF